MTELSQQSSDQLSGAGIFSAVRQFVLAQMNRRPDNRLVYHNYDFTVRLVAKTVEIGEGQGVLTEQQEVPRLAAWFVAIGYLLDYENHARNSQMLATRFLEAQNYPADKRKKVLSCLEGLVGDKPPAHPGEEILRDALTIINYTDGYQERNPLKKLEWELKTGRKSNQLEWAQLQLQRLLSARLYTHYARSHYEGILSQNIRWQKEKVEKTIRKQESKLPAEQVLPTGKFQGLEDGVPQRALQTFFRSNYRNHINLSAIADNKANIMISVNSILISVLLTILTYRNMANVNPKVVLPAVIFLVFALVSLIFAVLSARPKVTSLNNKEMPLETIRRNIVFFGNFVHLDLDQYEEAINEVSRDPELLYGNMTRDLYFLGKVLQKKYAYLTIAYNIFMLGFVVTVATFLVALFV